MTAPFDWTSIQLPKGLDYDKLYDHLVADPEMLDRLVREYLNNDPKWLENERKLLEKRRRREELIEQMKQIQQNNEQFDRLVEQMNQSIITAKTTTITDTLYYDDEYTYYSEPIQRVIDIEELKTRMSGRDLGQPSFCGQPSTSPKASTSVQTDDSETSNSPKLSNSPQPSTSAETMENQIDIKPNTSDVQNIFSQTDDDEIIELKIIESDKKPDQLKTFKPFIRSQPKVGDRVFAASNGILTHCWKPGTITKRVNYFNVSVQFDNRSIIGGNILSHRLIAYNKPTKDPIRVVGERVIAYLDEFNGFHLNRELYSGTVAEPAKNTNDFRYLIFFDKHVYRYVKREDIFYIYDTISVDKILEDNDFKTDNETTEYLEFLKSYFKNYPERPMVRLQVGDDRIKVRYRNRWETARVLEVDASIVLIRYEKLDQPVTEWIYRGSRRLYDIHKEYQTTKSNVKHRAGRSTTRMTRRLDDSRAFVEWNTAEDEKDDESRDRRLSTDLPEDDIQVLSREEANRKRKLKQTARKSTAKPSMASASCNASNMISHLLGDTIEICVEQRPKLDLVQFKNFGRNHRCTFGCINADAESKSFYDQNPFVVPLMVGYRRELVRTNEKKCRLIYRAPCGRVLRDVFEIWNYLKITQSKLDIDLFTFAVNFSLFRSSAPLKAYFYVKDITNGTEPQPISCVNTVDPTDLGQVIYKAERFPHPDVTFKPDPNFLSCCDCEDNCANVQNCSCQQLTLEASDAVRLSKHQVFGYEFKRLNDFVMTGIFECNQKCRCNQLCGNRVVQNGIKCRLQLFKTLKKGWGVRVLHDVPKGAFLCIYAAQILNEDAANKEGKTFGDEYLADLDYIDICETQKEGYESDVELSDEDYKDSEEGDDDDDEEDRDFRCNIDNKKGRPAYGMKDTVDSRNIISRDRKTKEDKSKKTFCIREDFFGEDFCYSLDAKKIGNIGRYLNHSCEPNCFVQNVFIDTHDLRFPWVSFFAKKDILAYEELSWDYNYEIGSIENRKMYCYCGAYRCRKRLL